MNSLQFIGPQALNELRVRWFLKKQYMTLVRLYQQKYLDQSDGEQLSLVYAPQEECSEEGNENEG